MAKVLTLASDGKIVEQDIALGGGFSIINGTASFDFGAKESDNVLSTIANVSLTKTNFKGFSFVPKETTSTFLEDFFLNGLSFNVENIIDNQSFDIRATANNNAIGEYQIDYIIQY